ncbi:hypothetical protein MKW94_021370 [Papaver nudicaule]|uniref:Snurportin-1 n=1 Tax=Papaver nudicaule TaxID=74823 RepID=A0AA41S065_PAPNU|nr:hypothetical protein [Papaver nudicaule]
MAPNNEATRQGFKRLAISDQQKRREITLYRQSQQKRDSQHHARSLVSSVFSFPTQQKPQPIHEEIECAAQEPESTIDFDVLGAFKLKGAKFRKQFSISRIRNGSILHSFPSALPNGSVKTRDNSGSTHSYCLLDCIFHEHDQTYYFRFFWLNSKIAETEACNPPSMYHRYKFDVVPIYACDQMGLQTSYLGVVPYVKDGLSFYNKHAHYQTGNTPLALVWKDGNCSQYFIDTDSKGQVPPHQHVVLVLNADGSLTTSDDPPIVFRCFTHEFVLKSKLKPGSFVRFTIGDGGMSFVDGKVEADLQYTNQPYRARASADRYFKIIIEDLVASLGSSEDLADEAKDIEMIG